MAATAYSASAALFTSGTPPQAPASRARLKCSGVFPGMRTIGALTEADSAANMSTRVRMSIGLCSVSTTSQSKPRLPIYSAPSGIGRASHVPTEGSPAASRRFT